MTVATSMISHISQAQPSFLGRENIDNTPSTYPFTDLSGANDRPVIGVFTQPLSVSMSEDPDYDGVKSYMMDNYVQFLESAGARVVPIIYGNPIEGEMAKLDHVNGLLFPGGDAPEEYLIWGK